MNKLYRLNGKLWCKLPIPLPLLLALFFFFLFSIRGHSQIVNGYAQVTNITLVGGKSQLTIANSQTTGHSFIVNEQVIVIQMQDTVIGGTNNDANFGKLGNISSAGLYEIATIDAITGSQITLHSKLGYSYNTGSNGSVQVVTFTKLNDASGNYATSGTITALPWSASLGRGGIIAFQVPGTLTLKNSITADGLGFAGGSASNNSASSCTSSTYISSSTSNGVKGEGIYKINTTTDPTYVRGRARMLTGGGGGSTNNGGGAGGGNFTAGGDGATSFVCAILGTTTGGLGGIALNTQLMTGQRLYLGGGGGGGQGASGQQTDGGAGGGIIIIKAGSITTSCGSSVTISANGSDADDVTGFTKLVGAGGGGAAGSILLQVGTYSVPSSCKLNVYANGGDGGNTGTAVDYGSGGGGGQGAVLYVGNLPSSSNVNNATSPGSGGKMVSGGTAPPGAGNNNDGVQGGIGVVLPAQLVYFGAENKNNTAVLNWTSTDESDVTYNIERSSDGVTFTNIGMVKGSGKTNYTFTDQHPENGINYYRLVITGNLAAKTTYSSVVTVSLTATTRTAVAYPNPAQDHFYIKVQADNNSMYAVTITDITGKPVYATTVKPANNIITVTPGVSLKPGLYMFKIASNGNEQSGKLMIK